MKVKKAIILFSSGIDSPVAANLANKKDIELIGLNFYFENIKLNYKQKLVALAKRTGVKKLYFANHSISHKAYANKCNKRYQCVFCKRMMLRVAEYIAKKENAEFIITGENIGQVASQTIPNMKVISSVTNYPIIAPVLCFNKNEITDIAKKIGTYELNLDFNDSCPFLPNNPATTCKENIIGREESFLEINKLVNEIVETFLIESIN